LVITILSEKASDSTVLPKLLRLVPWSTNQGELHPAPQPVVEMPRKISRFRAIFGHPVKASARHGAIK
jgi:hypothetical protein